MTKSYRNIFKSVVVTGGFGFIGYHLVKQILENYHDVIVVDDLIPYQSTKNMKSLKKNSKVRHFRTWDLFLKSNIPVSKVIHLAASVGARAGDNYQKSYLQNNLNFFLEVLLYCQKKDIEFFYASSSCAYEHNTFYGLTKYFDEKIAQKYYKAFGFRPFTVYGPRCREDLFFTKLLGYIKYGGYNFQVFNLDYKRRWTYVGDVVDQILNYVDSEFITRPKLINIAHNKQMKIKDLIFTVRQFFKKNYIQTYSLLGLESRIKTNGTYDQKEIKLDKSIPTYWCKTTLEQALTKMNEDGDL